MNSFFDFEKFFQKIIKLRVISGAIISYKKHFICTGIPTLLEIARIGSYRALSFSRKDK